jgi:hypothetical protein
MGYETRADLLHPTCTTDASPAANFFWTKIVAYIVLIYYILIGP